MSEAIYIKAILNGPIICKRNLPLDGLLMSIIARMYRLPPMEVQDNSDFLVERLPIEFHEEGFWHASWGLGKGIANSRGTIHTRKRYPRREAAIIGNGEIKKVDTSSGSYKSQNLPYQTNIVSRIEWWCRGDLEAVRSILSHCTHLGQKRSLGMGEVQRWIVEPAENDYSLLLPSTKSNTARPARALPLNNPELLALNKPFRTGLACMVPPYWDKSKMEVCAIPRDGVY